MFLNLVVPFQVLEIILSLIFDASWESHKWESIVIKLAGITFIVLGDLIYFNILKKNKGKDLIIFLNSIEEDDYSA